jgi:hypothetical protein
MSEFKNREDQVIREAHISLMEDGTVELEFYDDPSVNAPEVTEVDSMQEALSLTNDYFNEVWDDDEENESITEEVDEPESDGA